MKIPTEPIGSIPRPPELIAAVRESRPAAELTALFDAALRDTLKRFEATGSPVITDGEQTKPSFATYPIHGAATPAQEGVRIPYREGDVRQLPRLPAGPFRYRPHAPSYLAAPKPLTSTPL